MLKRCYSDKFHKKQPTYIGCTVCDEWLTFSNFKAWMEKQDWLGKEIDKDLLLAGNKVYSPETCVFVDGVVNNFISGCKSSRGSLKTGASFHKSINKFSSSCRNPISNKSEHLGFFFSLEDAHFEWKKRKHELACQLAESQTDERVAEALRTRYL